VERPVVGSLDIALFSLLCIIGLLLLFRNTSSLPLCKRCTQLFNTAPVAVITLDQHQRIIEWNSTAQDIFGWKYKEVYLQSFSDLLLPPEEVPHLSEAFEKAQTKGKSRSKHAVLTKNAEKLLCEWHHAWVEKSKNDNSRIVCVAYDVTDTQEILDDLTYRAEHDPLTGLYNRDAMQVRLSSALVRSNRNQTKTVLFFVDLDDFKLINDTYGHEIGDKLLAILSSNLIDGLRENDCICRYGGDEFVIIAEGIKDFSDLNKISHTIEQILNQTICLGNTLSIRSHASIGHAIYPDEADNADDLFRIADQSMYLNKQSRSSQKQELNDCLDFIEA